MRIRPLLSANGSIQEVSLNEGDLSVSAKIEGCHAQHRRATVALASDPVVSRADPASVKNQLLLQQQDEGTWRTMSTSAEKTETLSLVDEGGHWLVDEIA